MGGGKLMELINTMADFTAGLRELTDQADFYLVQYGEHEWVLFATDEFMDEDKPHARLKHWVPTITQEKWDAFVNATDKQAEADGWYE